MSEKYDTVTKLIDMVAFFILTDLTLSQQEKHKPGKETGFQKSQLLEWYKRLIELRGIVIGVIEHTKKSAVGFSFVSYVVEKTINAVYSGAMNLVYGIIRYMISTLSHTIETWQNMQLVKKIGTNPSHSQLAKDHTDHPLHSLAGDLALHAVLELGSDIRDMIFYPSKFIPNETSQSLIKKAKLFMIHPSQSNWADEIARKWIRENPDRLEKQHAKQRKFESAVYAGKKIEEIAAALQRGYDDFLRMYEETVAGVKKAVGVLEDVVTDFVDDVRQLKKKSEDVLDGILREMEDYYNQLLKLVSMVDERQMDRNIYEARLRQLTENIALKKRQAMELVEKDELNHIGSIEEQLNTYHQNVNDADWAWLNKKDPFEQKLFEYCYHDTADKSYREQGKQMKEYYAMVEHRFEREKEYLAYSPVDYRQFALALKSNKSSSMA